MKLLLFCSTIFFPFFVFAQSTKKILFIGNSYTYVNDLPGMLKNIALSLGDTVYHDSSTPGGYTFQLHSTNLTTLSKIDSQNWNYVILQAQSQEPALDPAQVAVDTYPFADSLVNHVYENDSCSKIMFYMTWGRKNGDAVNCASYPIVCTYEGMQYRLRQSYLEMAQNNNAEVSPVGISWRTIRQIDTTIELYQADESHPSLAGTYVAACTFYCSIFHKSLIGAYIPTGLDSSDAVFIQQISESTVFDSLTIWQIDTSLKACNYLSTSSNNNLDNLTLFPNPSSNELTILTKMENLKYTLFDYSGREIKTGLLFEGNNKISLDQIANGNYILSIYNNEVKHKYKVVIIK